MNLSADVYNRIMQTPVMVSITKNAHVAALGMLYLTYVQSVPPIPLEPVGDFLVSLVCQPSSRVRNAVISVLLLHPE
jgi:hypothetical protein